MHELSNEMLPPKCAMGSSTVWFLNNYSKATRKKNPFPKNSRLRVKALKVKFHSSGTGADKGIISSLSFDSHCCVQTASESIRFC